MDYTQQVKRYKKELEEIDKRVQKKELEDDKAYMNYWVDLCSLYKEKGNTLVLICAFSHVNLDKE